jgi:DNA-binding response OmpR family regulator
MKSRILVVDDEPDVLDLVTYNLGQAGFQTDTAADGAEALRKARSGAPDLILLDLMLPEMDGLEVCKLLRRDAKTSAIPIIMLTARASELDRIVGLELGAADYVPKPFSPRELVLRVKKRLEQKGGAAAKNAYSLGPLQVDVSRHLVTVRGRRVELTATEFKLLVLRIRNAHRHPHRRYPHSTPARKARSRRQKPGHRPRRGLPLLARDAPVARKFRWKDQEPARKAPCSGLSRPCRSVARSAFLSSRNRACTSSQRPGKTALLSTPSASGTIS